MIADGDRALTFTFAFGFSFTFKFTFTLMLTLPLTFMFAFTFHITFHRIFLRGILKLNRSTANCMVYGELGKCCIMNSVKERMVHFWSRLVTSKQSKI